jgi:hypothetical protein
VPAYTTRERVVALVALAVALAYQIYAVVVAIWKAPVFAQLFAGLGGELPFITRAFFATRLFWWLVPLAFAALSFDVLRRQDPSLRYFVLVLAGSALAAFSMHTWLVEAMYAPMYEILRKIG